MRSLISAREQEVLFLISKEYTTKEIASKLCISQHTAFSHRKNLLRKLKARNTAGLIRRGFEKNLLRTRRLELIASMISPSNRPIGTGI